MRELSDIELKNIFQQKLEDIEAESPMDSEQLLFTNLKELSKNTSSKIWSRIYLILLLMIIISSGNNSFPVVINDNLLRPAYEPTNENTYVQKFLPESKLSKKETVISKSEEKQLITKSHEQLTRNEEASKNDLAKKMIKAVAIDTQTYDSLIKVNSLNSIVILESKLAEIQPERLKEGIKAKKLFITFSTESFLGYKIIRPIADGIYEYNFSGPPSLSRERLGVKLSATLEKEMISNTFVTFGLSYFAYKNSLTYQANEMVRDIQPLNNFSTQMNGVSMSLGALYPLKLNSARKQFVQFKIESQRLLSSSAHSQNMQWMLSLGYANRWLVRKGQFGIVPIINYSITKLHYPGVNVQPYWVGLEATYTIPIR